MRRLGASLVWAALRSDASKRVTAARPAPRARGPGAGRWRARGRRDGCPTGLGPSREWGAALPLRRCGSLDPSPGRRSANGGLGSSSTQHRGLRRRRRVIRGTGAFAIEASPGSRRRQVQQRDQKPQAA